MHTAQQASVQYCLENLKDIIPQTPDKKFCFLQLSRLQVFLICLLYHCAFFNTTKIYQGRNAFLVNYREVCYSVCSIM